MVRLCLSVALFLAVLASAAGPKSQDPKTPRWQFAGENQGIGFFFKITNECKASGAKVHVKLESRLDHPVTVTFRINDPNWRQTFSRELGTKKTDTMIKFTPDDGTACHPYVDEVFVTSKDAQVTRPEEPEE